jgi:hypothetical protein
MELAEKMRSRQGIETHTAVAEGLRVEYIRGQDLVAYAQQHPELFERFSKGELPAGGCAAAGRDKNYRAALCSSTAPQPPPLPHCCGGEARAQPSGYKGCLVEHPHGMCQWSCWRCRQACRRAG